MADSEAKDLQKWQLIATRKKNEQNARIPSEWRIPRDKLPAPDVTNYLNIPKSCGILSDEELRLTEDYDATGLGEAIRKRQVKSVDVVRAFCKVCAFLNFVYTDGYGCDVLTLV